MPRSLIIAAFAGLAVTAIASSEGGAQAVVKIGAVQSMTGAFSNTGRETIDGARLYLRQHGNLVAGKNVELVVRDDTGLPDVGKRLGQELIVKDKVAVLLGGITPSALSIVPLTAESKTPMIVLVSGSSVAVERSPYVVRTSFTLGQSAATIGGWAAKNGARRIATMVNDWAPGLEAEITFKGVAIANGAAIAETIRVPLSNPDFSPFLQRVRDARADTLFAFVPTHQAAPLAKQFLERGLDKSGIRFVATGDLTPDDELPTMPEAVLGLVTAHHYSAIHDSELNKAYVAAFQNEHGRRPSYHSVAGYDAMHLIYAALAKTGGRTDGDLLMEAMKGMKWESPRGPIEIDPETRDIVQNEYIRKVELVNGQMYNVEFATIEAVKDPLHGTRR
jgi:branched-chain amino acid transport system substrate-binding protein